MLDPIARRPVSNTLKIRNAGKTARAILTTLDTGERLGELPPDLIDAIGVGVLVWELDRTLRYANARAVELAGRPLPQGRTCAALIAEARLCRADDGTPYPVEDLLPASIFEGASVRLEGAAFERPHGRKCLVEGASVLLRARDGSAPLLVTTFADFTDVRRAEAISAGEASVLAMVAEEAPLPDTLNALARVFEAHAEGMLASVLLVEGRRVRHAAAASLPAAWAKIVDGEPIGPNRGSCGTAAHLKEVVIVSDIAIDARWEPYRAAALGFGLRACWSTPILDHDAAVLGTFAFYYTSPREPTAALLALAHRASRLASVAIQRHRHRAERQRMERELRELREGEYVRRLEEAQRVADAATRAKSSFLANMSHEIRTPLNAILGYAQLLHRDQSLSGGQRRSIEVIHSSGRHLLSLVNDIIEMATLEEGRTSVAEEPLDLRDLLRELTRTFAAPAAQKGLELLCQLDANLVRTIDGDAVKVRQIVTNLLANALKFTERGRIVLKASSSPSAEHRHTIVISVEDTGPGIETSNLDRIFEAFEQPTSSTGTTGPGLGLALSLNLARLLGGRLSVESVLEKGSTFTLSFEAPATSTEWPESIPGPVLSGEDADALVPSSLAGAAFASLRSTPAPSSLARSTRLPGLVSQLPANLVEELRAAAAEARAGRITQLAQQARPYSDVAAREIEELAQQFRYEALLSALEGPNDD